MTIDEAISAVRAVMPKHREIERSDLGRQCPDYANRAIATLLNAVLDGTLSARLADADMAQAALVERVADSLLECSVWCDSQERTDEGWRNGVNDARKHHMAAIRALAPDAGVRDLAALRWERDSFRAVLEGAEYGNIESIAKNDVDTSRALGQVVKQLTLNCYADRDRLAAELAEERKQVEALRDMLADAGALRDAADRVSEWFAVEARHLEGARINALRMAMVAYDRHCQPAALAAAEEPKP